MEYVFPDSEEKPAHLKLLELAQAWKAKQKQQAVVALSEKTEEGGLEDVGSESKKGIEDENAIEI